MNKPSLSDSASRVYSMVLDRSRDTVELQYDDLTSLLARLSQENFDLSKALVYSCDSSIVMVLDEAPELSVQVLTSSNISKTKAALSQLRAAGANVLGVDPERFSVVRELLRDLAGNNAPNSARKARAVLSQWLPAVAILGVAQESVPTIAAAILAGLALFTSVFTILGFDRLIQSSATAPIKSLHRMYRADRYIVMIALIGLVCAIFALVFGGAKAFETYTIWGLRISRMYEVLAKGSLAGAVLLLMVCLNALTDYYLGRVWSRIEGDSLKNEIRKWKEQRTTRPD